MYSSHARAFDRLIDAGMTRDQVHILKTILCNPDAELEHNGSVTVRGEFSGADIRAARWAKCSYNWDYYYDIPSKEGKPGFVLARECSDSAGRDITGNQIKIFLPTGRGQDPNLESGDVVMFFKMSDGTYIAAGYGDSRVGSVVMGTQADSSARGWGIMDGTNNSATIGGSGLNFAGKFPRCWTASSDSGSTGGAASQSVTVAVANHNISDVASGLGTHSGSDVAGTISDHPASGLSHKHEVSDTTIGTGTTSTVGVLTGDSVGGTFYTKLANAGGSDLAHSGSGSLSHSGSGTISHTVTVNSGNPVDTIPPFGYVSFMERINNSRTKIGD